MGSLASKWMKYIRSFVEFSQTYSGQIIFTGVDWQLGAVLDFQLMDHAADVGTNSSCTDRKRLAICLFDIPQAHIAVHPTHVGLISQCQASPFLVSFATQ